MGVMGLIDGLINEPHAYGVKAKTFFNSITGSCRLAAAASAAAPEEASIRMAPKEQQKESQSGGPCF